MIAADACDAASATAADACTVASTTAADACAPAATVWLPGPPESPCHATSRLPPRVLRARSPTAAGARRWHARLHRCSEHGSRGAAHLRCRLARVCMCHAFGLGGPIVTSGGWRHPYAGIDKLRALLPACVDASASSGGVCCVAASVDDGCPRHLIARRKDGEPSPQIRGLSSASARTPRPPRRRPLPLPSPFLPGRLRQPAGAARFSSPAPALSRSMAATEAVSKRWSDARASASASATAESDARSSCSGTPCLRFRQRPLLHPRTNDRRGHLPLHLCRGCPRRRPSRASAAAGVLPRGPTIGLECSVRAAVRPAVPALVTFRRRRLRAAACCTDLCLQVIRQR